MKRYATFVWLVALVALGLGWASRAAAAGPQPVQAAPQVPAPLPDLPAVQIEQEAPTESRQRYSVAVDDKSIRELLRALGDKTPFSFVVDNDVEGNITVNLKQMTLEEMLDAVLTSLGLTYEREGNRIRVSRPRLITRIFAVNYIATTRGGSSGLSATAGASVGNNQSTGSAGGAAGGGSGGSGGGSNSSVGSTDTLDLWGELGETLQAQFLSPEGKVILSPTASLVTVTDYPANVTQVGRYLDLIQGAVHRQVMIEAKIIEVTLNKQFSAGINWSLIPYRLGIPGVGAITGVLSGGAIATQTGAPASGFQVGVGAPQRGIEAVISALQAQGTVSILSSPKVSTLNNQKAIIKVATDDVFFTQTTQREPLTGVVTQTTTPNTITEGLVLDVTPQIGSDAITMNIRPSISERLGASTSPNGDVVPIVAVRATDTVVRVRDGETAVIGGLMVQRNTRNRSGVPGLQSLPLLGRVFRTDTDSSSKVELVILLTPTVISGRTDDELTPRELEMLRQAGGTR